MGDGVREDDAFEPAITEGGLRLRRSVTCVPRGDGGEDDDVLLVNGRTSIVFSATFSSLCS